MRFQKILLLAMNGQHLCFIKIPKFIGCPPDVLVWGNRTFQPFGGLTTVPANDDYLAYVEKFGYVVPEGSEL